MPSDCKHLTTNEIFTTNFPVRKPRKSLQKQVNTAFESKMDFFLVNNGTLTLDSGTVVLVNNDDEVGETEERLETTGVILIEGEKGIQPMDTEDVDTQAFCGKFKQYLQQLLSGSLVMTIQVSIAPYISATGRTSTVAEVRLNGADIVSKALLLLGQDTIIHIVLTDLYDHQETPVCGGGVGKRNISKPDSHDLVWTFCEGTHDRFQYFPQTPIRGNLSIIVTVDKDNAQQAFAHTEGQKWEYLKTMLQEGIGSDANIIPSTGNPVKCHKSFLMTQSPVFRAMFRSNMLEARFHSVKIEELSEAGVRAFLAYLYYLDSSVPRQKCSIAVELLYASQKYMVPALETTMRDLLLQKEGQWYDVETAVKLFLLAFNLPVEEDKKKLKEKAVQALKANSVALEKSPFYRQLFEKDGDAALELLVLLTKA